MRMTKGRTILIQKDKEKGTAARNYRLITCLTLVWRLLTGVIAAEMYGFLDKIYYYLKNKKDAGENQD